MDDPKEMVERLRKLAEQDVRLLDEYSPSYHNGRKLTAEDTMYFAAADIIEQQAIEIAALKADREKLVRAVVERCAKVADEEKVSAQQMRDAARKEKDGQGALVHAAEAGAAFCIASALRSLNIDLDF